MDDGLDRQMPRVLLIRCQGLHGIEFRIEGVVIPALANRADLHTGKPRDLPRQRLQRCPDLRNGRSLVAILPQRVKYNVLYHSIPLP